MGGKGALLNDSDDLSKLKSVTAGVVKRQHSISTVSSAQSHPYIHLVRESTVRVLSER